jgi:hypothetical protein
MVYGMIIAFGYLRIWELRNWGIEELGNLGIKRDRFPSIPKSLNS